MGKMGNVDHITSFPVMPSNEDRCELRGRHVQVSCFAGQLSTWQTSVRIFMIVT